MIGETLDSVLAQTYQNWECIIVDDGSSDNTDAVVGEYVKKDKRFKYYHRPDEHLPGGNGARNYGFKMSKGEYVNWLDSDDLFSADKIEDQIEVILKNNSDIVTCKWKLSNQNLKKYLNVYQHYNNPIEFFNDLYKDDGYLPSHSYLIRRELLALSNLWNEYITVNQDALMFTQLIYNAKKISFADKGYCVYRKTRKDSKSLLDDTKIKQYISSIKSIEELHKLSQNGLVPDYFDNYKWKSFARIPNKYIFDDPFFRKEFKKSKSLPFKIRKYKKLIKNFF